ncbi:MAG: nuclear transport factor 2 family protein [Pararhodobacter sp.]
MTSPSLTHLADKLAIRELVDQWIIASDSGLWPEFDAVWHPDGVMAATWFQASAQDFASARRKGFETGVSIIHANLGHISTIRGNRAIAQTKMTISQRAEVHGVLVDVTATGRFYDFLEKREGRWGFVRRQPIYEKDRMDPVIPGTSVALDPALLARFPVGYRHLGYLQTQAGFKVKESGMPGLTGPEVERLYRQGAAWLEGAESAGRVE